MADKKRRGIFYGYIVVIAASGIWMASWGTLGTYGLFLKPLLTEFGWTRASGKEPNVFAGGNWDSCQFVNTIVRFIIESGYGYPTYSEYGSTIPLFQRIRRGDVHVFLEGWLPNIVELYDKAIAENQIADVGLLYGDAIQGWFVPRYVIEGDSKREIKPIASDLESVNDLERYRTIFASMERSVAKFQVIWL